MRKYYTLTVKTLAPVHIASGSTINKLEYVYSKETRTVYVMDMVKLSSFLTKSGLMEQFIESISSGDKKFSLTTFFSEKEIPESEYSRYAVYSYLNDNISASPSQMKISGAMKDAYGCPYVPGSSLKGVLRTAIAYRSIAEGRTDTSEAAEKIAADIVKGERLGFHERGLNTEIFHTLTRKTRYNRDTRIAEPVKKDILNDCMAGLYVSDSRPLTPESLILCEKTDLQLDGGSHTVNILRECIRPETEMTADVVIDTDLCAFTAEDMAESLECFYAGYDRTFRSTFISAAKVKVYEPEKEEGESYLYLGGGTGLPLKSLMYAIYKDKEEASELISLILENRFRAAGHKRFTMANRISPKVLKCTKYHSRLYEMGRCSLSLREKKI